MTEPRPDLPTDPQLSRLYREHAEGGPSAAADQRILALARQAVASALPERRRAGWWQRWRMPLGLAMTVMLTVTLALLVERQPKELPGVADNEKPRTEGLQKRAQEYAPERATVPIVPIPSPMPSPPASLSRKAEAVQNSVPGKPAARGERDASPAAQVSAPQLPAAPAPAAVAASAPSAAGAANEARASGEIHAAPALSAVPPAAAARAKSRADDVRPPGVWLEEIRALRKAGKDEEAEQQLRAFRLANPDYLLPEEFRR